MYETVEFTGEMGASATGGVQKKDVRNLFIILGALLLQLFVILEGLAKYFSIQVPLLKLNLILLGVIGLGLFVITVIRS
jgi:hypothetical protein